MGGKVTGNVIDIYFNTYKECRAYGVKYVKVYLYKKMKGTSHNWKTQKQVEESIYLN